MRDMAANLGGFLMGCYICERKPPKLQAISLRRFRSSVLLVRFAQPAKLRLRKTQAFFFAQNDRLIGCFAGRVCFREHQGAPLPVGVKCAKTCLFRDVEVLASTRSRSRSDSPPDCHSLRSRRFATPSPTTNFKIFRRGDSRIARFF